MNYRATISLKINQALRNLLPLRLYFILPEFHSNGRKLNFWWSWKIRHRKSKFFGNFNVWEFKAEFLMKLKIEWEMCSKVIWLPSLLVAFFVIWTTTVESLKYTISCFRMNEWMNKYIITRAFIIIYSKA